MNSEPKQVLVLEDEVLLAKNIAKYLAKHGYTVSTAGTVLDATRELREARIDVLLLDINLPDCNGLDFFEHIRLDYTNLRAIAMSGKDTSSQRGRARALGIDIFLAKPFPLSRMLAVVNSLFKFNGDDTPPTAIPDTGANVFPGNESTTTTSRDDTQGCSRQLVSSSKRILMYSHDTFGLGNIRRMLTIATELVEADENTSVLLLSGSPMVHTFRISPRIDYVKLPCVKRTNNGNYAVSSLDLSYQDTLRLRANLILSTAMDYGPDLVIVDKKPFGLDDELATTVQALGGLSERPKFLLLLRDILDSPEATISAWKRNGYYEAVDHFYDRILVVGMQEIFDACGEYLFPSPIRNKVEFCGYLDRGKPNVSPLEIRRRLGLSNEPMVFVTAGGGEDGYQLLSCYVEGLCRLNPKQAHHSVMMCGPEMDSTHYARLEAFACYRPKLTLRRFTDDMLSYMNTADVVVSMGGYNTICEILTLRKPAVVVPRVRPVQEQWMRVSRLAERNLLKMIHPNQLTPLKLMRIVQSILAVPGRLETNSSSIDLSGLAKIQRVVADELSQKTTRSATVVPIRSNDSDTSRYLADGLG